MPKLTNGTVKGMPYILPFPVSSAGCQIEVELRFLCNGLNVSFVCSGSLIVGSLEQIFQKEGLRGMYRGLSPTVLALLPNWAVSYSFLWFRISPSLSLSSIHLVDLTEEFIESTSGIDTQRDAVNSC